MARAIWNGAVIAESDDTILLEGHRYFPESSLNRDYLVPSENQTMCWWKGVASYYDVKVGDAVNRNAAWVYPEPKAAAQHIRGRVAFWHGVRVET